MQGLVIGPDFALGRGREGNAANLVALGKEMAFTVDVVPPTVIDGEVASSTAVRAALAEGDMQRVSELLGRHFGVEGRVTTGSERGRILGFPTANLAFQPHRALPPDGVYISRAYVDAEPHQSVTNIGQRPTFDAGERTVEVYLLDFEGDLYGRELRIELLERLRAEMRFASAEELKAQIAKDVEQARTALTA
jgi:riboflavin kinase/FMN adenylyltransferase